MTRPSTTDCPDCGAPMVSRVRQPKAWETDQQPRRFWGCSRYPRCKGTRDEMGRSRQEREDARREDPAPMRRLGEE
jgi:ssDNA-binding Zn-finger/Zn-ribbon topoisomerase 1